MYAATRPQEGRTCNEDAFVIDHGAVPYAALCDGAGNALHAAKRALMLFEKLFRDSQPEQIAEESIWGRWIKLLDSSLLGGTQTTFVGIALFNGTAIGGCAGDSRAYLLREGVCRNLTERPTVWDGQQWIFYSASIFNCYSSEGTSHRPSRSGAASDLRQGV